jgi:hypothetical protein
MLWSARWRCLLHCPVDDMPCLEHGAGQSDKWRRDLAFPRSRGDAGVSAHTAAHPAVWFRTSTCTTAPEPRVQPVGGRFPPAPDGGEGAMSPAGWGEGRSDAVAHDGLVPSRVERLPREIALLERRELRATPGSATLRRPAPGRRERWATVCSSAAAAWFRRLLEAHVSAHACGGASQGPESVTHPGSVPPGTSSAKNVPDELPGAVTAPSTPRR